MDCFSYTKRALVAMVLASLIMVMVSSTMVKGSEQDYKDCK